MDDKKHVKHEKDSMKPPVVKSDPFKKGDQNELHVSQEDVDKMNQKLLGFVYDKINFV